MNEHETTLASELRDRIAELIGEDDTPTTSTTSQPAYSRRTAVVNDDGSTVADWAGSFRVPKGANPTLSMELGRVRVGDVILLSERAYPLVVDRAAVGVLVAGREHPGGWVSVGTVGGSGRLVGPYDARVRVVHREKAAQRAAGWRQDGWRIAGWLAGWMNGKGE